MIKRIIEKALENGIFNSNLNDNKAKSVFSGFPINTDSFFSDKNSLFMIYKPGKEDSMLVLSEKENILDGFAGDSLTYHNDGKTIFAITCPLNGHNADILRKKVPFTSPSVLDCRESFGTGDRIGGKGSATSGHIDALKGYNNINPVLAQQSVRENTKTGRSFQQVMDDVTWAVFRKGYRFPWGADADHLKNMADIETAADAGFTMFTIDPSDMIDNDADKDNDETLRNKFGSFFKNAKEADRFISKYDGHFEADARAVVRSGVKYLGAIDHAYKAYKKIGECLKGKNFNFEMSIDETLTTTSSLDHYIIANELHEKDVRIFSLAPRFEGEFEKGIDYKGSLDGFRKSLDNHFKISKEFGEYRLSLHSGSDKFSIYPIFGEITDGFYHVKTAGTSYLEAVKTIASEKFDLFKRIFILSYETFDENAKSYHISADIKKVIHPDNLDSADAVKEINNNPDMRQVLHIAFGPVLKEMGDEFRQSLSDNSDVYDGNIESHIGKHLRLLTGK